MKPPEFKYQEYARGKIERRGKTAVIAPPGAGKTRPIVEGVLNLCNGDLASPILVICSGPAISTWKRQIPQWGDDPSLADEIYLVSGNASDRRHMWADISVAGGIVIINAAVFRIDYLYIAGIRWSAIIADEYHKYMLRRKSQTYKLFLKLTRHHPLVVLATGSVVRRDPSSMFTCFQILDPKVFTSYWRFVETFCLVEDGYFGKEIVGARNVEQLKQLMDRYMAYIPEEVVADQLPQGHRMQLPVEMDSEQEPIYKSLKKDMLAILTDSDRILIAPNVIGAYVKLRQLLCCPRALDQSLGMGAGFEAIVDELEEDPHVAIFVPFRLPTEIIATELRNLGYEADYIRGGISPDELRDKIDAFRKRRGILVSTIQYAESFDLETCQRSYFLGYDYSLDQNKQAEGRTRRAISEHKFVTWKYVCYTDTVDEPLLEKLIVDHENVEQVLRRPKELIALLKGHQN